MPAPQHVQRGSIVNANKLFSFYLQPAPKFLLLDAGRAWNNHRKEEQKLRVLHVCMAVCYYACVKVSFLYLS